MSDHDRVEVVRDDQCGGSYQARVEHGHYDIVCRVCGALAAAGPAADVGWMFSVYRDRRCHARPSPQ